jgi:hypothetical protein
MFENDIIELKPSQIMESEWGSRYILVYATCIEKKHSSCCTIRVPSLTIESNQGFTPSKMRNILKAIIENMDYLWLHAYDLTYPPERIIEKNKD